MKKLLLTGIALIAIGPLACSGARAQNAAACKSDCSTGSTHGLYRPYNQADPNLISPEGRKLYAECVRLCLAPLPSSYFQKSIIESGGSWFGKFKSDCLRYHPPGEFPLLSPHHIT